jgi:CxxC motif-containing protein
MIRNITCIECPVGCSLRVDIENCRVVKVEGHKCPKGEKYAVSEVENPVRVLASSVLAQGLSVKMIPVKTDTPIPKERMMEAMAEIKKIRVNEPVGVGDTIKEDLLGLGVRLVVTRSVET